MTELCWIFSTSTVSVAQNFCTHFDEDNVDRQLLPIASLFYIVRIHIRPASVMCGRQMRMTMRCHHAHGFWRFDFHCLFRLDVSFYCYVMVAHHPSESTPPGNNIPSKILMTNNFTTAHVATFTAYCILCIAHTSQCSLLAGIRCSLLTSSDGWIDAFLTSTAIT